MIQVPDGVAAVILDMMRSMAGPASREIIRTNYRRAYWLKKRMAEAFDASGVDEATVERAYVPHIRPEWMEEETEEEGRRIDEVWRKNAERIEERERRRAKEIEAKRKQSDTN